MSGLKLNWNTSKYFPCTHLQAFPEERSVNGIFFLAMWWGSSLSCLSQTAWTGLTYFSFFIILWFILIVSVRVMKFFWHSILYASETYYDLKENEIRAIKRIEEQFLRKLFNTTTAWACSISHLYLEVGHFPARFEVFRRRLLFQWWIIE